MGKTYFLLLLRIICACLVAWALPESFIKLGPALDVQANGPFVFVSIIILFCIGIAMGVVYFAMASVTHYFLRKGHLWKIIFADLALFAFFIINAISGGANATFNP